jgi:hypothetical protein
MSKKGESAVQAQVREAASLAEKKLKAAFCAKWQMEAELFKKIVLKLSDRAAELTHIYERLYEEGFNVDLAKVVLLSMEEHPKEVQEFYIRKYFAIIIQLEDENKFFLNGRIQNPYQTKRSEGFLCPLQRYRNYFSNSANSAEIKKSDIQLTFVCYEGITKLEIDNTIKIQQEYKVFMRVSAETILILHVLTD